MNVRNVMLALALAALVRAGMVLAEEAPVAPKPSGGVGSGIKDLPGTVENDVDDAVKKDMGGMAPGSKAKDTQAGKAGAATDDDMDHDLDDDDTEEDQAE